jgi:hypothetical protein
MTTKNRFIILSIILSLALCQQYRQSNASDYSSNKYAFKDFIRKFGILQIPIAFNTTCFEPDITSSNELDMDNDSTFIGYVGPSITIGLLPDTTNFYAIIYCTAAACYIPTLAVFSKKGERLSIEPISHGCGSDVGYRCTDSLFINSITDIKSKMIEEEYKIDKDGNPILNTMIQTITIDEFSINKVGLIIKKQKTATNTAV